MGGDRRVRDAVVHSTTERCWRLGGRGEHAACGTATGGGWLQGPSSAAEAAAISIVTRPVAAAEASSLVHDAGATPQEHRTQQQQFRPSLLAFCYVQRRLRCISGLFSRKERPSPAQSGYPHSTTTGANREVSLCCQDLATVVRGSHIQSHRDGDTGRERSA
jgi:hypothetical protein